MPAWMPNFSIGHLATGQAPKSNTQSRTFFYPGTYTVELIARERLRLRGYDTAHRGSTRCRNAYARLHQHCLRRRNHDVYREFLCNPDISADRFVQRNGFEWGRSLDDLITVQWNSGPSGTIALLPLNCAMNTCTVPLIAQIPVLG